MPRNLNSHNHNQYDGSPCFYLAVLSPFTTTVRTLHSEMIRNDNLHIKPYEVKGTQFLLRFAHVAHANACAMAIHGLYGELAATLVRATTDRFDPGPQPARAGAKLDGSGGLSAFDGALGMLRKLELGTANE